MAGHFSAAKEAMFAVRARMNHDAMIYFIAAIASMAVVFVIHHFLRLGAGKMKKVHVPSPLLAVTRKIRFFSIRKVPALPSMGHAGLVSLYVITNIVLMFAHVDYKNMALVPNLASRTGWLAIANMVLVVFLALKNTPLAFLTSWSYERLNVLHQVSGCMTLIHVILHASCYSAYFVLDGRSSRLLQVEEIYGMVAGISFLALVFSGVVIRPFWYELFYYTHISFWIVGIVMVGLHQPEISKKIIFATCVAGGIWVLDRLVRMARVAMYSFSNEATLHPLPNGGTRITLKKAPMGAKSGKHCFLWIPKIRSCETHPFTIASADPVEFVIASYDGFTRDLHQYALKNPGVSLKASVDGPYGTFPPPTDCDEMILVAGGSGASFVFGAALNALKVMAADEMKRITIIWTVKQQSQLQWFSRHIRALQAEERVSIHLYVTQPPTLEGVPGTPNDESQKEKNDSPNVTVMTNLEREPLPRLNTHLSFDSEKGSQSESDAPSSIQNAPIEYKRPDVPAMIRAKIDETPVDKRVLIMGCGPDGLIRAVRNTGSECIRADGPAVEIHCEQFGW